MKGPAPYKPKEKIKSPKPDKGKKETKWNTFDFNGKGPVGEEARALGMVSSKMSISNIILVTNTKINELIRFQRNI